MTEKLDTNTIISKNLEKLMSEKNVNNRELAEKVGVSESTVGKWLLKKSTPRMGAIEIMADFFGVRKSDILEWKEKPSASLHSTPKPLVGSVAAGTPILAEQNIEDYFYIDNSVDCDFCLRVKGDSMIGDGIQSGDIAFIKSQPQIENGDIGVVVIEDEATLKRIFYQDNAIVLQPSNPSYQPIILTEGNVRVAGKLVAVLNKK